MPPRIQRCPRIFVVEDEDDLQTRYIALLEHAGYDVTSACNLSEAALAIARPQAIFDAAVLDLALPDGCGSTLVRPLMARVPLCRSAVITGQSGRAAPVDLARIGAEAYVYKPVAPKKLLKAVKDTVRATTQWRRTAGQSPVGEQRGGNGVAGAAEGQKAIDFDVDRAISRIAKIGGLTPTQVLTATRMLWGDSDAAIARYLGCGTRTAQYHVRSVLQRLGISNRVQILRVLLEDSGSVDPLILSTD